MRRNRPTTSPRLLAVAIAFALAMLAAPAAAQKRGEVQQARKHYEQGTAFYRTGLYERAAAEFEQSYALDPQPKTLFNIGRCYEEIGDPAKAIDYYRRFLDTGPTEGVPETKARVERLERVIAEREAASREHELAEERRTQAEQRLAAGRSLAQEGKHDEALVELRAAFELTGDAEIVFEIAEVLRSKGDRSSAVVEYVRYRQLAPAGPNAGRALEVKAQLEAEISEEIAERERRSRASAASVEASGSEDGGRPGRSLKITGLVTMGVGGVSLAVGAVFGMRARSLDDEVSSFEGDWTVELDQKVEDGEAAERIAVISLVVGGTAVVAGGVLTYLGWRKDRQARERRVGVVPVLAPDGAGIAVWGAF